MSYNITILIIALVLLLVITIAKLIKYLSRRDKGYMIVAVKLGPFSLNVKTSAEDYVEHKD